MSPFTDASRVTAIGALPPFTGTKAKDPLPPSCGVPVGRHEGQLWVRGGCRRQANARAGLPSAPEMPCAPPQLRSVPRHKVAALQPAARGQEARGR
jgi:hypothetical protein